MNHIHQQYENLLVSKAPRARSKKIRKYEHVDLTREFQIRQQRREAAKKERLEELYERHDKKAESIRGLTVKPSAAELGKSDISDTEGMTTDGDEALSKRKMMMEIQE